MLIKVDLPAPFSPTMPVMAPLAMASDTPRTAWTLPNDFWMPESSIAGADAINRPAVLRARPAETQPPIGVSGISAFSAGAVARRGRQRPTTAWGYRRPTPP